MSSLKKGGSGLMEVDDDNQKIRRCPTLPLPEWNDARRQELMDNTVYVKGNHTFINLYKMPVRFLDLLRYPGNFPRGYHSILNIHFNFNRI